jgi:putative ABC transport system permease protein
MLGYYLRLALQSFGRDPGATALMVFAIALGIGVCVMTLTVYHAMSSNPIWWKNDRLYAITMDSWPAERPASPDFPNLPPNQMTYMDADYFFNSDIPERKVRMYQTVGVVLSGKESKPLKINTRVTTADFFPMFDVPFRYGNGWSAQADVGSEAVIVLSHELNARLFGGANSVGRTLRWSDHDFRIIGVLQPWMPQPKFYDLTIGAFNEPEAAYVPWGWGKALQLLSSGNIHCWKIEPNNTVDELMGSECAWVQMWVELPTTDARDRMRNVIETYWGEQRKAGRFPRPRNNRLSNVGEWLEDHQVVQNDNRLLVGLAFAFLSVCLLNTIGLLLAKFLNGAPVAGVRRALGASRLHIFSQHLIQAGVLAVSGALLGLGLSALFLWGVRILYSSDPQMGRGGYQALAHFDALGIAWAIALAFAAVIITGLYPAWRIGRMPPARYLKSL